MFFCSVFLMSVQIYLSMLVEIIVNFRVFLMKLNAYKDNILMVIWKSSLGFVRKITLSCTSGKNSYGFVWKKYYGFVWEKNLWFCSENFPMVLFGKNSYGFV